MRIAFLASAFALSLSPAPASAALLAIFGQNNIGSYYAGLGETVTYVTDSQLATAGFLNNYDAFIYTRDGYSFGQSLSVAAAANVKSYVTGNVVLFNGDFQDDIGDADTNALFSNALTFALAKSHSYIGEYRGSFAAFATNDDGDHTIGLVNGNAGQSGYNQGGSNGNVSVAPGQAGNPLLAGVSLPYNPGAVEYGSQLDGYNPARVVLQFDNGNPALLASDVQTISAGVPEPSTWAMMLVGFFGLAFAGWRKTRAANA